MIYSDKNLRPKDYLYLELNKPQLKILLLNRMFQTNKLWVQ